MIRYFFDSYDDDSAIHDEEGIEFSTLAAAEQEAARGLAELALTLLPGAERRTLVIKARTAAGPLFETRLVFEIVRMAGEPDQHGREQSAARN